MQLKNFQQLYVPLLRSLYKSAKEETFTLKNLGNMDQTPLPFAMDDSRTYEKPDAVWIAIGQSGLETSQYTVQLNIFADGSTLPPANKSGREKTMGSKSEGLLSSK